MSSKVKYRGPYDPVILLLVIYSREMKTYIHIKTFTCSFIVALFIIAKNGNNPNIHQLMNKQNMVHPYGIHNGILFSHERV